jgi:DNA polymerase-4
VPIAVGLSHAAVTLGLVRTRVILHVDMDAFFVSVELLRRPELVGKPVVVGGTGRRGVVAAASYEARRYGVFSAMPSARARQLCPSAVFLQGDYDAYASTSAQVHEVFESYTPRVEGISLDEAFLDVTGSVTLFGDGVTIGHRIRADIADRLSLTCSVGVAPNKFLAKMASVEAKPRARPNGVEPGPGVFEVAPGDEVAYLHPLPVRRLWGVGPSTYERLSRLGVTTIGDLAAVSPVALHGIVGRASAVRLLELASGVDDRPVESERPVKSISHEETFAYDLFDRTDIRTQLVRMADGVATRLRASGLGARTISLKVRDATFTTLTRSRTLPRGVDTAAAIVDVVVPLMDQVEPTGGVRLLGVVASKFAEPSEQLQLDGITADGDTSEQWSEASAAIDRVRGRFGSSAIGPASALSADGLRIVRRGQQQWGTNEQSGSETARNDRPPD